MADVQDSTIQEAYDDVRNDKTSTNWLLLNYESERSDKLKLSATGSEGLNELKDKLEEDQASFVYARITYANDKESQRHKFILIIWIGPKVKVMRKAKLSVHRADVKCVLRQFSIEVSFVLFGLVSLSLVFRKKLTTDIYSLFENNQVPASSAEDLNEESIVVQLRKAGGASYDKA
ncbi:hypothetical protein PGTUg99_009385 [Puccinia graminis f. sp. tritici]|uniref:ADF-H domain-containing protein n=1 Tax=Puccinia graminis f. sp. tritici TaxID=56615 RepID=A0A5B0SBX7_PUCGR|nr:hypothetical protein PGTUg99_009385 [Puccinia graminis f. sp. tritici]